MTEQYTQYSLRLYDEELLTFSLGHADLGDLEARVLTVHEPLRHLFPLDLTVSDAGVLKWLKRRIVPKNRVGAREILEHFDLSPYDVKGLIDVSKGLSLNDSYWVPPRDYPGSFAEENLFENAFSEPLARIAFCGGEERDAAFARSPELTTNGMLPKAWRRMEDGGVWLYKSGAPGPFHTGFEPYSEYYAGQVAARMELLAVPYELEMWMDRLASKCRLFTDKDTSFVPIGRIVRSGNLKDCLDYYGALSQEAAEQLKDMLVFDAVIYNEDRHFGNFGILRDNHTGKILGAAPIFDNGRSLFYDAQSEQFAELTTYAKTCWNPYGISYNKICRVIMGDRQREKLQKLRGFSFARHPRWNLTEERLSAIEEQLRQRVEELLTLSDCEEKEELEESLPDYVHASIEQMKRSWAAIDAGKEDTSWDIYWCELQADINFAEHERQISPDQARFLRKKYLRI